MRHPRAERARRGIGSGATAAILALSAGAAMAGCRDDDPRPPDVFVDWDQRGRLPDGTTIGPSDAAARDATADAMPEAATDAGGDGEADADATLGD